MRSHGWCLGMIAMMSVAIYGRKHDTCSAFESSDSLIDRIDALETCLSAIDTNLSEDMIGHELDMNKRNPWSMFIFANTTETLNTVANSIATTYFHRYDSERVSRIDMLDFVNARLSKDSMTTAIHSDIVAINEKCSRRNMVVIENVQLIPNHLISTLDVFLQPLSGKIGKSQYSNEIIDTLPTIFLFLFRTDTLPVSPEWKKHLELHWDNHGIEFTPWALIGRIQSGVVIDNNIHLVDRCQGILDASRGFDLWQHSDLWTTMLLGIATLALLMYTSWAKLAKLRTDTSKSSNGLAMNASSSVVYEPRQTSEPEDLNDEVTFIPKTKPTTHTIKVNSSAPTPPKSVEVELPDQRELKPSSESQATGYIPNSTPLCSHDLSPRMEPSEEIAEQSTKTKTKKKPPKKGGLKPENPTRKSSRLRNK